MQWDGSSEETHGEFELQNVYIYTPKDADSYLWSLGNLSNALVLVYKLPINVTTSQETKSGDVYFTVKFNNLSMEGDGNLVGYTDNSVKVYGSYDKLYTTWVTENKDNYYITIYNADRSVAE